MRPSLVGAGDGRHAHGADARDDGGVRRPSRLRPGGPVTGAGLHAGLLHESADGLVELSGPGYARIPASEITEALQDEPVDGVFRWPGASPEWGPGPPTHVGIYAAASADAPRTAIALPAGAVDGGRIELPADGLRQLLVGA